MEITLITPKLALAMLERNRGNRSLDRHVVDLYADAMNRNEWRLTHQGIAFDPQGELLDGQHRLTAVVKANVSVMMLVVYGVSREHFPAVDTGKRRSGSNALHLLKAADPNSLAAALRYLYLYDNGKRKWSSSASRLTNDQLISLYREHPRMTDCVRAARQISASTGIITSACATAIYVTRRAAPDVNDSEWFDGIVTGANLDVDDVRLAFRRFFANARSANKRRHDAEEHLAIYIKAWNVWIAGETRKVLAFRKGEEFPPPLSGAPVKEGVVHV